MPDGAEFEVIAVGGVEVWNRPNHSFDVAPEIEEEVDYHWERAVEQSGGHLFNGAFLNLISHRPTKHGLRIDAHFAEYKYFYVHRRRPSLELPVQAIGVSGITILQSHGEPMVLLGRRSGKMTQYPGYWELAPSGTVDPSCAEEDGRVRYEAKLLEELHEEAGIPFSRVESINGFAFVYDRVDRSYDVCCRICVRAGPQQVLDALEQRHEYSQGALTALADLSKLPGPEHEPFMPVSKAIIAGYGLYMGA